MATKNSATTPKKTKKKKESALGAKAVAAQRAAREAWHKATKSGAFDDEKRASELEQAAELAIKQHGRETFERVAGRRVQSLLDTMRKLAKLADSPKVYFEGGDLQQMFTAIDAVKNIMFTKFNEAQARRAAGGDQPRFRFPKLRSLDAEAE